MKTLKYRAVIFNIDGEGFIGELQQLRGGIYFLIAGWYTPRCLSFRDDGLELKYYINSNIISNNGDKRAIKLFNTLDEFKEWFIKKYFMDIL